MGKCYEDENVFAIISRLITRICSEKQNSKFRALPEYATHDEIVAALKRDLEARREIEGTRRRCPHLDGDWLASNMVAWWSQTITVGKNPWKERFDRKKHDGKYAYKPKHPA